MLMKHGTQHSRFSWETVVISYPKVLTNYMPMIFSLEREIYRKKQKTPQPATKTVGHPLLEFIPSKIQSQCRHPSQQSFGLDGARVLCHRRSLAEHPRARPASSRAVGQDRSQFYTVTADFVAYTSYTSCCTSTCACLSVCVLGRAHFLCCCQRALAAACTIRGTE
jgi:hypothetical protein